MGEHKHYIRVDANGNVIRTFSDAFEQPQVGDLLVTQKGGRHFNLDIWYNGLIPRWYIEGNEMKERTDKELLKLWEEHKAAHPPELTEVEKLRAKNDVLKTLIEDKDRENKNALFEIYGMLMGG